MHTLRSEDFHAANEWHICGLGVKNQDAMIAAYEISFTWTINEWPESGSVASFAEP